MKKKKQKKFDKFLHQSIDVENSEKQKYLNVFYQIYNESDTADVSLDEDFKEKLKSIPSDNKKQISFYPILRYAAVVALVLGISVVIGISIFNKNFVNYEIIALDTYSHANQIEFLKNKSNNLELSNIKEQQKIEKNNNNINFSKSQRDISHDINLIAEIGVEPLEIKKSIIPLQENIDYRPEEIDTRTFYQGLQNITAMMEQEEMTLANDKHKNQIIINTWNNIKNFIGEGIVPDNLSLASAYNFIKNTNNKQEK